jgi:ribosome-binding protein aMBF1 (putative translation factor)
MNVKLKMAILESGVLQKELAKKIGVHPSVLSMVVQGKYIFDQVQRAKISKALGKPEHELFTYERI